MNFSINRKPSKMLSLALVLIMLTTLFSGCTQKAPAPETEPGLNLNLNESSTPSETTAPAVDTVDIATALAGAAVSMGSALLEKGDTVVLTGGMPLNTRGSTNMLQVKIVD